MAQQGQLVAVSERVDHRPVQRRADTTTSPAVNRLKVHARASSGCDDRIATTSSTRTTSSQRGSSTDAAVRQILTRLYGDRYLVKNLRNKKVRNGNGGIITDCSTSHVDVLVTDGPCEGTTVHLTRNDLETDELRDFSQRKQKAAITQLPIIDYASATIFKMQGRTIEPPHRVHVVIKSNTKHNGGIAAGPTLYTALSRTKYAT